MTPMLEDPPPQGLVDDMPPLSDARPLGVLGADDLPWVGALTDAVVALVGQPWRVALEAIEAGTWMPDTRDARAVPLRRLSAAVYALRRMLSGRAYNAALAREARSLVLGVPALSPDARQSRIAIAAGALGLAPRDVEQVLWADLPRERPIEFPRIAPKQRPTADAVQTPAAPPTALNVAAQANVSLVQRALRRAHSVELVVRGDASRLLRGASAHGLLVTASERIVAAAPAGRELVLDIVGPLALCHGTAVYGRALGGLVPLLGTCIDFTLTIHAEARGRAYDLVLASPALLPPPPPPRRWRVVEQLARDLERLGMIVMRSPAAIAHGGAVVCPDLGIEVAGRTIWIEIIGFWTPAYLARKLARYQAAAAGEVVLCVDSARACDDDDPPSGALVVQYERRIHANALAQLLGAA